MDFYVYIRSDETDKYFPENKAFNFTFRLNAPITLKGFWKVGLVEFYALNDSKSRKTSLETLYIYSDICKESIINGSKRSMLRRVFQNDKSEWKNIFDSPFYLPLNKKYFQEIEIQITVEDLKEAIFLKLPTHLTLHFKQYSFYADYESL